MAAAHAHPRFSRRWLLVGLLAAVPLACDGQRDADRRALADAKRRTDTTAATPKGSAQPAVGRGPTSTAQPAATSKGSSRLVAGNGKHTTQPVLLASERKTVQQKAVAALELLDARVERDEKNPDKPVVKIDGYGSKLSDADLKYLDTLDTLQSLDLKGTSLTDAGLEHLRGLTGLQTLSLNFITTVTGKGLEPLQGLTHLQHLDLGFTKVDDAGLEHLKGMTELQTLVLQLTLVSDAGLEHLKGLTHLQSLDLRSTKVTAAGVQKLQQALPKVRIEQ